jgi:hypothetical protein
VELTGYKRDKRGLKSIAKIALIKGPLQQIRGNKA